MDASYDADPVADLPNLANPDYQARVNRAIDHITANLDQPLPLEDVAKVACFSPYHFHRIFRALVGETLGQFIKRVRLERALYLLSHRPGTRFTEVALTCGFSSSSDFSRSFKAHFGVPPRVFDAERFRKTRRQQMELTLTPPGERSRLQGLQPGDNPDGFSVAIRDLPPRRVAYLRVHQPYEGDGVVRAIEQLVAWARERNLHGGRWLGYQWEDPEIVPLDKCRYDVAVEVPESAVIDDGVSEGRLSAMSVAEVDVVGTIELEMRALDWMYKTWLPSSAYVPDHQPGFEVWKGEPFAHGHEHFELWLHLPVVAASGPL